MNSHEKANRRPKINGPGIYALDDPIYQRECTLAVDASVESLVRIASEAGWDRQHVIVAIIFAAARQLDDQATFDHLARLGYAN